MPKRPRSNSVVEEAIIDGYVSSCVNFKGTVRIVDPEAVKSVAPHVLLIGTPAQLQESAVANLPFYCPEVAEAVKRAAAGSTVSCIAKIHNNFTSVTVSALPAAATRNNCPYRPDAIAATVSAITGAFSAKEEHHLDIYVRAPAGAEAAVASAVARACPHSFTTKENATSKAALVQSVHVNIIFASRAAFTGEKVNGKATCAAELENLCTSVQLCQRLVDTPPCTLDTVVYVEIAQAYAKMLGAEITVIKGEELREKGYGGIWNVGKCAEYPPALVTLRYTNPKAGSNAKNIALVGKGIVYDCGGLALKPAASMCNMKTDMGGSAGVFGAFITVVRNMQAQQDHYQAIRNLSVTLCMAENAIGPNAYRNDDIVIMKSGKSVEVKNTDAEGRICLGDGAFYATNEQDFVPDVFIDMATLTGAQLIATGTKHAAVYVNNTEAERGVVAAGLDCGDLCFPVLYCPEFHGPQYKSPCADMRNVMHTGENGVACGGYFVEQNLSPKFKGDFIHVDIAFPSFDTAGATGYGVNLIAEYLKKF